MNLHISETPEALGALAAEKVTCLITKAVNAKGSARIMVSTGQSQFAFFEAIARLELPWEKVEIFHLDEYIGIPATHKASFRKYLKERFIDHIGGAKMHYISGEGEINAVIAAASAEISRSPIDVGVIGIGENGHIAFNDPPADFETKAAYHIVTLDAQCRRQQVNEGWFPTVEDVPETAVSATIHQILSCKSIVSVVPHKAKAVAVRNTLEAQQVTPQIPATALTAHPDWHLFLDSDSASLLSPRR